MRSTERVNIAAGKVQRGYRVLDESGAWFTIADVRRDETYVIMTTDTGHELRRHNMRALTVERSTVD